MDWRRGSVGARPLVDRILDRVERVESEDMSDLVLAALTLDRFNSASFSCTLRARSWLSSLLLLSSSKSESLSSSMASFFFGLKAPGLIIDGLCGIPICTGGWASKFIDDLALSISLLTGNIVDTRALRRCSSWCKLRKPISSRTMFPSSKAPPPAAPLRAKEVMD